MPKKIDPLNKKQYCSVTPMLTVSDVKAAADFYQKAFGFAKRGNYERPRRQSGTCRAHASRYDSNVGARNAADGFAQRENSWRLTE